MVYIVVDTNFLLDQLDVLKRFTKDLEDLSDNPQFPPPALGLKIVIPSVVLSELDGWVSMFIIYSPFHLAGGRLWFRPIQVPSIQSLLIY